MHGSIENNHVDQAENTLRIHRKKIINLKF